MVDDLPARLQAYFAQALPNWPATLVGPASRIGDGWESELYTFEVEHGSAGARQQTALVLRLYPGEGAAAKAEQEFHGMRRLYQSAYPVPRVHHLALAGSPLGQPFILMDRIDGEPLWPGVLQRTPAEQQALLGDFCELFVQLHRLDWRPFAAEPERLADAGPFVFVDEALAGAHASVARFELAGFGPVVDWLAAHRAEAACPRPAVVHGDFHPANVLRRTDGTYAVIDWSGLRVSDPRFDLGWTLMLAQSHAGTTLRGTLLRGYEGAAGETVRSLDYFEVFACARRLGDVIVSLTHGAMRMGMRPEAAALMRAQLPAVAEVLHLLEARTGLRVPEVAALLG